MTNVDAKTDDKVENMPLPPGVGVGQGDTPSNRAILKANRNLIGAIFDMVSSLSIKLTGEKPTCLIQEGSPDRVISVCANESNVIWSPVPEERQKTPSRSGKVRTRRTLVVSARASKR